EKLMRFDWNTGKTLQEIPIPDQYGGVMAIGDELLLMEPKEGKQVATYINLTNCDWKTEEITKLGPPTLVASGKGRADGTGQPELAGLPTGVPGTDMDKPMDPKKVAEQAQRLSYPARLALPAVLSNARSQERLLKELQDDKGPKSTLGPKRDPDEDLSIIPTKEGFLQVAVKIVEKKFVEREAMKPPAPKSVTSGPTTAGNSDDLANEILNEMQRERGGGVIRENKSRYRVTLRAPEGNDSWVGEVSGAFPSVYPLTTVNVLAAGKLIQVFDQKNKKLWESKLNFEVFGDLESLQQDHAPYGMRPCVERKDTLYVIDEGVLTAFDIKTGNVRWRYPSIGIIGIFIDDEGMLYVNTTSAGPDTIKHPHQINIGRKDVNIVLKIDPNDGKVLWKAEPGGLVNYVSGKYLYTVQMYMPDDEEVDSPYGSGATPSNMPPFVRIKRINPRNGHVMWEHFQQRAPVDIQFDKNTIRMVFKKEVQILKFLSL
ncbi:MAG TPA: PQQ-binding-like beta-propeller repeat protein, partial [Candidatus Eisenbacteria bacterium]|nr:PQQ-binding-like beta-propeller repeat protein [Candidatus Eisenbacteria bacterium]